MRLKFAKDRARGIFWIPGRSGAAAGARAFADFPQLEYPKRWRDGIR